jgi:hypothetical protein
VAAAAAAGHRPVMLLLVGVPGSGGWCKRRPILRQQPQQPELQFRSAAATATHSSTHARTHSLTAGYSCCNARPVPVPC